MTHADNHPTPDRYASSPGRYLIVAGALLALVVGVVGAAAGVHAAVTTGVLLVSVPALGSVVLAALCLAVDVARGLRHRAARCRAGVDRLDVDHISRQAHAQLARRTGLDGP
jgi:hypothetical protein